MLSSHTIRYTPSYSDIHQFLQKPGNPSSMKEDQSFCHGSDLCRVGTAMSAPAGWRTLPTSTRPVRISQEGCFSSANDAMQTQTYATQSNLTLGCSSVWVIIKYLQHAFRFASQRFSASLVSPSKLLRNLPYQHIFLSLTLLSSFLRGCKHCSNMLDKSCVGKLPTLVSAYCVPSDNA